MIPEGPSFRDSVLWFLNSHLLRFHLRAAGREGLTPRTMQLSGRSSLSHQLESQPGLATCSPRGVGVGAET